jgi:hypothetical protein
MSVLSNQVVVLHLSDVPLVVLKNNIHFIAVVGAQAYIFGL